MGFLFKITNDVLIKIKQQIIETELQSICFDFESWETWPFYRNFSHEHFLQFILFMSGANDSLLVLFGV